MEKTISAKHTLIKSLIIMLVPLVLVLGISACYSFEKLQETVHTSVQDTLYLIAEDINRKMDGVNRYLNEMALNNTHIHQLSLGSGKETADELNRYEVYGSIRERMRDYGSLTAVHLYTSGGEVTLSCINEANYLTNDEKVNLWLGLNGFLAERIESGELEVNTWGILIIGGRRYFYKAVKNRETWLTALFEAEHMGDISLEDGDMEGTLAFFWEGEPQNNIEMLKNEAITWDKASAGTQRIRGKSGDFWTASVPLKNFTVMYFVPYKGIASNLQLLQILLVALSWGFVIFILCAYKLLKKNYFRPMDTLMARMDDIGSGRMEMENPSAFVHTEFRKLDDTFNRMIRQIKDLKISSYEKVLEMKQIQLVSLQNQIRPHFYLNCLKNLYALMEQKRYGEAQNNILLLSRHFRYVFSIEDAQVDLEQEILYCQNYVRLFSNSYSQQMQCETDIMPDAMGFKVPSISLLTFVENSVKYGRHPDQILKIQIKVKLLQMEGSRILSITVADNGAGFQPEVMEKINGGRVEADYEGGVGIGNVLHRCRLLYGDKFSYGFYNADGAVVDLFFETEGSGE